MPDMLRRSLGARLYMLLGLLAMAALGAAGAGGWALQDMQVTSADAARAARAARLAERVNGHIFAVVAESRGIYHARDAEDARRFAAPMEATLRRLERDLAAWRPLVPLSRQTEFARVEDATNAFVRYRTETIRIGLAEGPAAANVQGNNEANRANRRALNEALENSAGAAESLADELSAQLDARGERLTLLLGLGAAGAVLVVGLIALTTVRRSVLRPLLGMTARLGTMAEGDLASPIADRDRADEIGRLARAAETLRLGLQRAEELAVEQQQQRAVQLERATALDGLASRFESSAGAMIGRLSAAAAQLNSTARTMS
ncbi:HAMP domain-containing protein, partial [Pseudoroseomonas globiformis]